MLLSLPGWPEPVCFLCLSSPLPWLAITLPGFLYLLGLGDSPGSSHLTRVFIFTKAQWLRLIKPKVPCYTLVPYTPKLRGLVQQLFYHLPHFHRFTVFSWPLFFPEVSSVAAVRWWPYHRLQASRIIWSLPAMLGWLDLPPSPRSVGVPPLCMASLCGTWIKGVDF